MNISYQKISCLITGVFLFLNLKGQPNHDISTVESFFYEQISSILMSDSIFLGEVISKVNGFSEEEFPIPEPRAYFPRLFRFVESDELLSEIRWVNKEEELFKLDRDSLVLEEFKKGKEYCESITNWIPRTVSFIGEAKPSSDTVKVFFTDIPGTSVIHLSVFLFYNGNYIYNKNTGKLKYWGKSLHYLFFYNDNKKVYASYSLLLFNN